MEFGSDIGYFVHNHSLPFFRRLLSTIDVLSHQTLADTKSTTNSSSIEFRMRQENQRYSCWFGVIVLETLK